MMRNSCSVNNYFDENSSDNILLNEAYAMAKAENHEFCQSIQHLLSANGLGHVWLNPSCVSKHFHKIFRDRLYDQYEQYWNQECSASSITTLLFDMKNCYKTR